MERWEGSIKDGPQISKSDNGVQVPFCVMVQVLGFIEDGDEFVIGYVKCNMCGLWDIGVEISGRQLHG